MDVLQLKWRAHIYTKNNKKKIYKMKVSDENEEDLCESTSLGNIAMKEGEVEGI